MSPFTSPGASRPKISKSVKDQQLLIDKQHEMIELYRETSHDRDQIINHLKRLVDLQEIQIDHLKLQLSKLREKQ